MSQPVKPLPVEDLEHVLKHTRQLWEEARGASFFITGGTGFFGMWLLETFAHINDALGLEMRATVLTRNAAAFAAKAPHLARRGDLTFVHGDIRQFPFPCGVFDHIIHAGTTSSVPVEPKEMFDTIVDGTRRVLAFAAQAGCRKLLFVSSGAVYGRQPPGITHVPEGYRGAPDPLDPASAYGEAKRAAEMLCTMAGKKHGFETKIARCFAFVGPHLPLDAHFAVGNFIRDALEDKDMLITGDGETLRSYLHSADLAVWLWTIFLKGKVSSAYNVGSEHALRILEVAQVVKKAAGAAKSAIHVKGRPPEPGQPGTRYVPDVKLAQEELGLQTWINLPDAVCRTLAWHHSHS
jgi:dTDP-glucose 4,6-dehydratase